ncbi:MAG TPA: MlaD family protein [Ignavibacteriales bacterium]|nr:MlaD family protein [Ignavibacteriales bacterium]
MNELKKAEFKVGFVSIIAIAIFFSIMYWAKNLSLGDDKVELTILFDNVAGLEKGDAVSVNGVKKGKVVDIYLQNNKSLVKVVLQKPIDLRKDATFAITMIDLMGGKKIDISSGKSDIPLDYTQVQHGYFAGDIPFLVSEISKLSYKIPVILDEISLTLNSMNKIINDDELLPKLKETIKNVNELVDNVNGLVKDNKENIKIISQNTAEITQQTKDMINTNKDELKLTLSETKHLVTNLNELTRKVDTLLAQTQSKKNNLGKLLYDEKLIEQLNTSAKQLKEIMDLIQNQLQNEGVNVRAKIRVW